VSLPPTATIIELKEKLAGLADVPVDRQRLIYSGRVMKNDETLETYKVKSGNTVHMVKGAASNAAANPANASSSTPRAAPRLASGGNDPLNNITGARYAGHVQLPRPEMFGPDGGMGPPPDPEHLATAMQNPMFQAHMNELLSNPQMLEYLIQSNPMLQSLGPEARQIMQSDMFRQMMTNPDIIRHMGAFGGRGGGGMFGGMGGGAGAPPAFPEPGRTDTTPAPAGGEGQQGQQEGQPGQPGQPGQQNQADLINMLLGGGAPGSPGSGAQSPPAGGQMPNMQSLLPLLMSMQGQQGQAGAGAGATPGATSPGAAPGANPFAAPPNIGQLMQALGGAGGNWNGGLPPGLGGLGGMGGFGGAGSPPPPADNRPPEERYADQLRQLNDMGFFDFDRNVEALRRSGGSVQGAVNQLLGG